MKMRLTGRHWRLSIGTDGGADRSPAHADRFRNSAEIDAAKRRRDKPIPSTRSIELSWARLLACLLRESRSCQQTTPML